MKNTNNIEDSVADTELSESQVSRRTFLDVLGKVVLTTSAFSVVLSTTGCGGGKDEPCVPELKFDPKLGYNRYFC